jgi:hypothetical protein
MSKRVIEKEAWASPLEGILGDFRRDGTHPDFPVKKFADLADWTRLPWSELAFELPALVVYGPDAGCEPPAVAVVFAVSHTVEGTEMLAVSRKGRETLCHRAEVSPEGKQPAYLLVKAHLPLADAP